MHLKWGGGRGWARALEAGVETQVGKCWLIPQAIEDMTAGTMHSRLQLGLRKEEAELGQWEKKTKRLQADLVKAVQARESREAANRKELKKILGLQPSLRSVLLCLFGVS